MSHSSGDKPSRHVLEHHQLPFPLLYFISADIRTEPHAHLIAVGGGYHLVFGPTDLLKFASGSRVISVICRKQASILRLSNELTSTRMLYRSREPNALSVQVNIN